MALSKAQKTAIADLGGEGKSAYSIAKTLKLPRSTVYDYLDRLTRLPEAPEREAEPDYVSPDILHAVVRPLAVEMPAPVTTTIPRDGVVTAVVYSDSHVPNEDKPAIRIVAQITAELQPSLIVNLGDLLDCYLLSTFQKDPSRLDSLQTDIDLARAHLASMRLLSPKSRFVLLEGNHEDRLRRVLWNLDGPARTLAHLTAFQEALTWPSLLGLKEMGIEFFATDQQAVRGVLPGFLLKHGNKIRAHSAFTAKAEMERYCRSGLSGHTHRMGVFCITTDVGDQEWHEVGCTCLLKAEYTQDANWQQAFAVVTVTTDGRYRQVENIRIREGRAVFRGKTYDGNL